MSEPTVLAAVISGVVSLLIAGVTGGYVVLRTRKRIDDLRDEIIAAKRTERFLAEAAEYRTAFRDYESTAHRLSSPEDHSKLVQHLVNFYANSVRRFYEGNPSFLKTPALDSLYARIALASEKLNDPSDPRRLPIIQDLVDNIVRFARELYERSAEY